VIHLLATRKLEVRRVAGHPGVLATGDLRAGLIAALLGLGKADREKTLLMAALLRRPSLLRQLKGLRVISAIKRETFSLHTRSLLSSMIALTEKIRAWGAGMI
jgi:hypothetical protein